MLITLTISKRGFGWATSTRLHRSITRDSKLYSPVNPMKDNLTEENLVHLHPRKRISSDFPQSNDPEIDIIILQPQTQQQSSHPQREILHLKSSLHGHRYTDASVRSNRTQRMLTKCPPTIWEESEENYSTRFSRRYGRNCIRKQLHSLSSLTRGFCHLGLWFQSPRPLVRDNGVDRVYQPHEALGGLVQPALEEHFKAYLRGSTDKNNTPLYLFLGGAGTGKSRDAMEFPQTLMSCSDKDSDLRGRLAKAKAFLWA